jgi:hypothetical protein
MSSGFEIKDSSGNTTFSQDDLAWRFVDSFYVGPTESGSKSYPELGANPSLAAYATPVDLGGGHRVTINGNSVSWVYFHGGQIWVGPYAASYITVYQR